MSDPYEREAAKAAIKALQRELAEAREIVEMQKETMRQMREKYGLGERNVMRELRQEIENLNKIIDAATNSANASHFRAIEYQSQRDTLAEACRKLMEIVGAPGTNEWQTIEECDAAYLAGKQALAAVKGGKQ
jgi:hypothetical protein